MMIDSIDRICRSSIGKHDGWFYKISIFAFTFQNFQRISKTQFPVVVVVFFLLLFFLVFFFVIATRYRHSHADIKVRDRKQLTHFVFVVYERLIVIANGFSPKK